MSNQVSNKVAAVPNFFLVFAKGNVNFASFEGNGLHRADVCGNTVFDICFATFCRGFATFVEENPRDLLLFQNDLRDLKILRKLDCWGFFLDFYRKQTDFCQRCTRFLPRDTPLQKISYSDKLQRRIGDRVKD